MRPGEENLDGPPIHGNTRLEVIWTAIPAIILVGLCTYAFVVLEDVEAAESNPVKVRVVGEQFAWTFFYRRDGKEIASRAAARADRPPGAVHAPVQGRAARLLGPGVPHQEGRGAGDRRHATPSRPNRLGAYPIVCAELCGLGHAVMRSTAPWSRADYDASRDLGKPAAPAGGGGGGAARRRSGRQDGLHRPPATAACHTLADAGATGTIGPDLGKVLKGKDEAFIKQSIVDPSAEIAPGYQDGIMPPDFEQTLRRPRSTRW